MRSLTIIIFIFIHSSCVSQDLKTLKYSAIFADGDNEIRKDYYINVPKGGKVDKRKTLTGDYHTEYRIVYPDSSIIYISNDEWRGSSLNFENRHKAGVSGYNKEHLTDTLENGGQQENGNYWRENILGGIVVGYINAPPDKKEQYDRTLATIRKRR